MTHLRQAWAQRVAEGSLATGLFWRVHDPQRPFGPQDATSTPWYPDQPRGSEQEGFSCFSNPWHLWTYLYATVKGAQPSVIGFSGKKVGEGADGEDLAIPDMKLVKRMSLDQFERELLTTPFPPSPSFGPKAYMWTGTPTKSWAELAKVLAWRDDGGLVTQHIVKAWS